MLGLKSVRSLLARRLVRWAARWIDASYSAYMRVERNEVPSWYATPWHFGARQVNQVALPLAAKLNREAAGAEMAEQSWWG